MEEVLAILEELQRKIESLEKAVKTAQPEKNENISDLKAQIQKVVQNIASYHEAVKNNSFSRYADMLNRSVDSIQTISERTNQEVKKLREKVEQSKKPFIYIPESKHKGYFMYSIAVGGFLFFMCLYFIFSYAETKPTSDKYWAVRMSFDEDNLYMPFFERIDNIFNDQDSVISKKGIKNSLNLYKDSVLTEQQRLKELAEAEEKLKELKGKK